MSGRVTLPGQHQPTVSAWIFSDSHPRKVLLVWHEKFQVWIQPGGHIEPFEHVWQAVIREALEETGLELDSSGKVQAGVKETWEIPVPDFIQLQAIPAHKNDPQHYHVDHQYIFSVPEQPVRSESGDPEKIQWFPREAVQEMNLYEDTKQRIEEIFSRLEFSQKA